MVWSTRLNDPKRDAMVTIMQRLHEKDVSGRVLELGGWDHLCLPAEYDGTLRSTSLGVYDPRTKSGELLWPDRFGEKELRALKTQLGEYGVSGQLQQLPTPAGGGILKIDWFELWPATQPLPVMEYVLQSYDTAFTEKTTGDPTACSVWGVFRLKGEYRVMVLDAWSDHLEYPDLRAKVIRDWASKYAGDEKDVANKSRSPDMVLIEQKGSGQSLLQDLGRARVPVTPYNPGHVDKVARAHIVAPLIEAGLVYLPESKKNPGRWASWADGFMKQVSRFPNDEHDDYVDTMSQALRFLHDKRFLSLNSSNRFEERAIPKTKKQNPYAA
jgi:predicted phage terminase large subunit-like protein